MMAGLRRAMPDDVPAIRALVVAAYEPWVPVVGCVPVPMTADYDAAVRVHRIDLLEESGSLVALIETRAAEDHLMIENVAVAPEAQRQGLGRRLLAHAESLAAVLGLGEMRLVTNSKMLGNIRLYRSLGYIAYREEDRGDRIGVHMRKPL
jgi:ribosomal protein S18 acetylase RimI-like enzyme